MSNAQKFVTLLVCLALKCPGRRLQTSAGKSQHRPFLVDQPTGGQSVEEVGRVLCWQHIAEREQSRSKIGASVEGTSMIATPAAAFKPLSPSARKDDPPLTILRKIGLNRQSRVSLHSPVMSGSDEENNAENMTEFSMNVNQELQTMIASLGSDEANNAEKVANVLMSSYRNLKKTYETQRLTCGPEHTSTLEALNLYSAFAIHLGGPMEAVPLVKEAHRISCGLLGREHPDTLMALENFVDAYIKDFHLAEAEPLQRKLLKLSRRAHGSTHENTLRALATYAIVLGMLGRLVEAEPFMKESLEGSQQILGLGHPDTAIRFSLYNDIFLPEAEAESDVGASRKRWRFRIAFRRAFRGLRKLIWKSSGHLVPVTSRSFETPQAGSVRLLERLQRMYELKCRILGQNHQETLKAMNNCAVALDNLGRHEEAEALMKEAFGLSEEAFGPAFFVILETYADFLNAQGRAVEAHPKSKRLFYHKRGRLGPGHPDSFKALDKYVIILDQIGRRAEAGPMIEEAARLGHTVPVASMPEVLAPFPARAPAPDPPSAPDPIPEAELERLKKKFFLECATSGAEHPNAITALIEYSLSLEMSGRHAESLPLMRQALQLCGQAFGPEHPSTLAALRIFADALINEGNVAKAKLMIKQLLEVTWKVFGAEHPNTVETIEKYSVALDEFGIKLELNPKPPDSEVQR